MCRSLNTCFQRRSARHVRSRNSLSGHFIPRWLPAARAAVGFERVLSGIDGAGMSPRMTASWPARSKRIDTRGPLWHSDLESLHIASTDNLDKELVSVDLPRRGC